MKETNEDLQQSDQSEESVPDYNKNYILGMSALSASMKRRLGENCLRSDSTSILRNMFTMSKLPSTYILLLFK